LGNYEQILQRKVDIHGSTHKQVLDEFLESYTRDLRSLLDLVKVSADGESRHWFNTRLQTSHPTLVLLPLAYHFSIGPGL
jgi:hypothetical protein